MKSPVKRGENRGRLLQHDFVVLGHAVYESSEDVWRGELPAAPLAGEAERFAIAAWVSPASKQMPLQAVGGWLAPGTSLRR